MPPSLFIHTLKMYTSLALYTVCLSIHIPILNATFWEGILVRLMIDTKEFAYLLENAMALH